MIDRRKCLLDGETVMKTYRKDGKTRQEIYGELVDHIKQNHHPIMMEMNKKYFIKIDKNNKPIIQDI